MSSLLVSCKISLLVKFLIVISNCLIHLVSYELEQMLELVDGSVVKVATWFCTTDLVGGGGKSNNPKWGMGNGAYLGGKLGNYNIIDFNCNLLEDINLCSKVLVVWYTSKKECPNIKISILRSGWKYFL